MTVLKRKKYVTKLPQINDWSKDRDRQVPKSVYSIQAPCSIFYEFVKVDIFVEKLNYDIVTASPNSEEHMTVFNSKILKVIIFIKIPKIIKVACIDIIIQGCLSRPAAPPWARRWAPTATRTRTGTTWR